MINKVICLLKGHLLTVDAGSCPYTGKSYKACSRCMNLEAV